MKQKGKWGYRAIRILALVSILVVSLVTPVWATAGVFEDVSGVYTVRANLRGRYLDGTTADAVRTGTLTITGSTLTSRGVLAADTLALTGLGSLTMTGFVGTGASPYISAGGSDADNTMLLNGRIKIRDGNVTSISGRIDGYSAHSGGTLGDDPAGAAATWSTADSETGTVSALLTQAAVAGSTYVQWTPQTGIYLSDLATMSAEDWGLWYNLQVSTSGGPQLELRFTAPTNVNPDGVGHVDVTLLTPTTGTGLWAERTYDGDFAAMYYGNDPYDGTAYSDDAPETLSTVLTSINAEAAMLANGGYTADDWELTRVRVEIWEAGARTCYVDDVMIDGEVQSFEPVQYAGTFSIRP